MQEYLPYITAIIAISGFVFSVWKYIDLKNREECRLDYENINALINYISGAIMYNRDTGRSSVMPAKYISNIYQLSLFKNQSFIILPFLGYIKLNPIKADQETLSKINQAIDYVLEKLK